MKLSAASEETLYRRVYDYAASRKLLRCSRHGGHTLDEFTEYPDGRLRYWVQLLCAADDLLRLEPSDFERDSLQSRLINAAHDLGHTEAMDRFQAARSAAWKLLVDQAERQLTGVENHRNLPFAARYQACRATSIVKYRSWMDGSEELWTAVAKSDRRLMEEVAKRAEGKLASENWTAVMMGKLWVHPDCPLWLMRADPVWRIVKTCMDHSDLASTEKVEVSQANFNRLKRDHSLPIFLPAPIIAWHVYVPTGEDQPWRFGGYDFRRDFADRVKDLVPEVPPGFVRNCDVGEVGTTAQDSPGETACQAENSSP